MRELHIKSHAIQTCNNGIMLTDLEGKITYINPAFIRMWGCGDFEELLGPDATGYLGIENFGELVDLLKDSAGRQKDQTVVGRDGSKSDVTISASLIRDESSQAIGIMGVFTDVTKDERFEAAFR